MELLVFFAGSFNQFHIGHKNVLEQAIKTFDNVVVIRMKNFDKPESKFDKLGV
jgi:cytidyltransferase-like protein